MYLRCSAGGVAGLPVTRRTASAGDLLTRNLGIFGAAGLGQAALPIVNCDLCRGGAFCGSGKAVAARTGAAPAVSAESANKAARVLRIE